MKTIYRYLLGSSIVACVLGVSVSFAIDVYINPSTNRCQTIQGTACHQGNATLRISPNSNPHCFTCEQSISTVKACGNDKSVSKQQGGACSNGLSCHRCECNTNMQRSGDGKGGSTICVCKNPETMIYNQQKLDCETCPSGEHPNEAGTACEKCPAGQEWKNGKCEAIAEQCSNGTEKPANGECPPVATPSNPSNTNDARKACKEQEKAGTHRRNPSKKECEDCSKVCCGTKLNTNVPFIGNCIVMKTSGPTRANADGTLEVTPVSAFPTLIGALMRILTSTMLVLGVLLIIVGGVMMTMEGANSGSFSKGKSLILKVGGALALLGLAGLVLKLINPTFFT